MIVAFLDGMPLLLNDVRRDLAGSLIGGHVINGEWRLERMDAVTWDAGGHSQFKASSVTEVAVPEKLRERDYNWIIEWAIKRRNKR